MPINTKRELLRYIDLNYSKQKGFFRRNGLAPAASTAMAKVMDLADALPSGPLSDEAISSIKAVYYNASGRDHKLDNLTGRVLQDLVLMQLRQVTAPVIFTEPMDYHQHVDKHSLVTRDSEGRLYAPFITPLQSGKDIPVHHLSFWQKVKKTLTPASVEKDGLMNDQGYRPLKG
jgi:hypothetical protein